MYNIVAEAKVRDAERAAREWSETGGPYVIHQPHKILRMVRRLASLTFSFLA